jgi:hypothetical protein
LRTPQQTCLGLLLFEPLLLDTPSWVKQLHAHVLLHLVWA